MERIKYYDPHSFFELTGKRNHQEFDSLLSNAIAILDKEASLGYGKLGRTINETRMSAYGNAFFVDSKIAYLPSKGTVVFIGDTHGDSMSTETIVKQVGFLENMNLGKKDMFLTWLGDYPGKCGNNMRNLEIMLGLKIAYPKNIVFLEGNNDEYEKSRNNGLHEAFGAHFLLEEYEKFKKSGLFYPPTVNFSSSGNSLFHKYRQIVEKMPNMIVTGNGIVGVHGGIPSEQIEDLFSLKSNERLFNQIRLNYPNEEINGLTPSTRPKGACGYGYDMFEATMNAIGGKVMIGGHQHSIEGFINYFDNRQTAIFSTGGKSKETDHSKASPKIAIFNLAEDISKITPQHIVDVKI